MKIPVDTCNTVIFDLGNVLVHYDAHHMDQYDFDKKTKIRINQVNISKVPPGLKRKTRSTFTDGNLV